MRILITGIAGFVGSNLLKALQIKYPKAEITGYDNFLSGDFKNLEGFKGELHTDSLDLGLSGNTYSIIFHLGSNTDTTNGNIKEQLENNINDFRNVLNIPCKTLIYASSASVYGVGAKEPNKEIDPLKPANAYAFSKAQLENLISRSGKNAMGFRFFNVYGTNETHKGKSASMVTQILGKVKRDQEVKLFPNGEQKRDFIYVKDVCNLLIKAAENPNPGIYNCGTGNAVTFNEVFETAKKIDLMSFSKVSYFKEIPYSFFQSYTCASLDKVSNAFDWQPKYNLEEGMRDYKDSL